jgi:tetratricopeptide (TPR) repeat protein
MKQPGYYQQIPSDYYAGGEKKAAPSEVRAGHWGVHHFLLFAVWLSLVNGAWARTISPATQPASLDDRVGRLIDQLRSDNADKRQSAAADLIKMGGLARPAILKLTKSPDPGLQQQAAQILLGLPWYAPDDPAMVKKILLGYGTPDIESRREIVRDLADLAEIDNGTGLDALSRLVSEDPSPAVQWTIVKCLFVQGHLDAFQAVQPPADDSRLLALCGLARLSVNLPAALDDLRQSAELELANPTDDDGAFDFVIRFLVDADVQRRRFDQAADWRRKELARGSGLEESGISTALLELFALQADFGPLKGLEDDLRLAGGDIQKPQIQYALGKLYRRMQEPAKAQAALQAALAASTNRLERYYVGKFLYDHGWDDLAEREFDAYLKRDLPDAGEGMDNRVVDANVHFCLGGLAMRRGDDGAAAHEKETAMLLIGNGADLKLTDAQGRERKVSAADYAAVWADIYWRYLRAAVAQHDEKEVGRRLEQLLERKPTDPDIAIDVVPILRQRGRSVDADLLFKWSYDPAKKDLDAHPDDPQRLNELAWLCAKCDRNLAEARVWAEKAVKLAPDDAAILDTLAEVNFHLGRPDEAARIETQALNLQPDDPYMKKQLQRYAAAAKGK